MPPNRLGIIGYGKMGRAVEEAARRRGYAPLIITDNRGGPPAPPPSDLVGWVDFSSADAVPHSVRWALATQRPLVIGTTGWYDQLDALRLNVMEGGGRVLWAANFDMMMQLMFVLTDVAARLLRQSSLRPSIHIHETHHTAKKDAPSGTALHLERLLRRHLSELPPFQVEEGSPPSLSDEAPSHGAPRITYARRGEVFGEHRLQLTAPSATVTLEHAAHNRSGFAHGAIDTLEWLQHQPPGFYSINDYIHAQWLAPAGISLKEFTT